jgi:para-aminobenzoate synthetase
VVEAPALPFDFQCGYVGFFGYELKADCGSPGRHRAPTPDACWLFADRMVVVDHEEGQTYLVALDDGSAVDTRSATAWLISTEAALAGLTGLPADPLGTSGGPGGALRLARGREQYLADVVACQRELLAGESYEICLTNSVRLAGGGDGYSFYRRLRRGNPAPYAAYLRWDGIEVACSSPERFLKIGADRVVETKPIKGTAPRGRCAQEDEVLRAGLASDPKNLAENLIVVDLLRNDLGRVCEIGSVHLPKLMAVESYATVHHLVSTVRGRLRPGADALDCVRACFPGGSMTGAPKLRTMEIIDSLEGQARGVYSGAIGFLGCDGRADLNIVIRTAVLVDGEWQVGAGGAVVLDSDPEAEYEEMLLKAEALVRARG